MTATPTLSAYLAGRGMPKCPRCEYPDFYRTVAERQDFRDTTISSSPDAPCAFGVCKNCGAFTVKSWGSSALREMTPEEKTWLNADIARVETAKAAVARVVERMVG